MTTFSGGGDGQTHSRAFLPATAPYALADEEEIFRILALDHESTLERLLAARGHHVDAARRIELKLAILESLAGDLSAVLLDLESLCRARDAGLVRVPALLKVERTWTNPPGDAFSRLTVIRDDYQLEEVVALGAEGVKLMIYYRPDAPLAVRRHQQELARTIGERCAQLGLIYALEPCGYALKPDELGGDDGERRLAERRPRIVIDSVREFSKPEYRASLLKVDFPADLRFAVGFAHPHSESWEALYSVSDVHAWCEELDEAALVPWTVMSSGASNREFVEYVRMSTAAGGSGFICGQGIWADALAAFPDLERVRSELRATGVRNLRAVNDAAIRPRNSSTRRSDDAG